MDDAERSWRRRERLERWRWTRMVLIVVGILTMALWWMTENLRS